MIIPNRAFGRAQPAYPPRRKTAAPSAPAAEKIDYGSVDHAGRPKRGKVSDAEKATVAAVTRR